MTRRKDSVILNLSKRIVTYHIRKNATLKRRKQRKLLIFNGIFDDSLRIKRPRTTTSRTSGITGIRSKQKTRIINKEKKRQRRDPLPFCCGGFHHSGPSGQLPFQGSLYDAPMPPPKGEVLLYLPPDGKMGSLASKAR